MTFLKYITRERNVLKPRLSLTSPNQAGVEEPCLKIRYKNLGQTTDGRTDKQTDRQTDRVALQL